MEVIARLNTDRIAFHHTVDVNPDPRDFLRHCHDTYEVIYVVEGNGRYIVEGNEYALRPRTLLLLPPRAFHYVDLSPEKLYERYVIHFRPTALPEEGRALLSSFPAESIGNGHFYSSAQLPPTISAIFTRLDEVARLDPGNDELLTRLCLSELLLILTAASPEAHTADGEPLGRAAVRYLNSHLTEPLSLDTLAHKFYVSKFYLCRAFREHNGVSVLQYITEKRVFLAKQFLEDGETAVVAAAKAGFGDYSSFYRAYRKILGISPKKNKSRKPDGKETV